MTFLSAGSGGSRSQAVGIRSWHDVSTGAPSLERSERTVQFYTTVSLLLFQFLFLLLPSHSFTLSSPHLFPFPPSSPSPSWPFLPPFPLSYNSLPSYLPPPRRENMSVRWFFFITKLILPSQQTLCRSNWERISATRHRLSIIARILCCEGYSLAKAQRKRLSLSARISQRGNRASARTKTRFVLSKEITRIVIITQFLSRYPFFLVLAYSGRTDYCCILDSV